jgi:hypothetical protein
MALRLKVIHPNSVTIDRRSKQLWGTNVLLPGWYKKKHSEPLNAKISNRQFYNGITIKV